MARPMPIKSGNLKALSTERKGEGGEQRKGVVRTNITDYVQIRKKSLRKTCYLLGSPLQILSNVY